MTSVVSVTAVPALPVGSFVSLWLELFFSCTSSPVNGVRNWQRCNNRHAQYTMGWANIITVYAIRGRSESVV